jgi:hypothetical protein
MTRRTICLAIVLAVAAGACATIDRSPDGQWQAAYDHAGNESTPEAALQESQLALEAVAYHPGRLSRLGRDPDAVAHEGLLALWRAFAAHPEWQDAWQLLDAWRSNLDGRFDAAGASQAVCPAADRTRTFTALRLCGDLLAQSGRAPDAIARWRPLLAAAQDAGQRNSLIVRIEHASLQPTVDLQGLTQTDLQAANEWEREREQRRQAARQAEVAAGACAAACESQRVTCDNAQHWWGPDCEAAANRCTASCQSLSP